MSQAEKYKPFAELILQKAGGKENVASLTHCMTRLRFNFKDESAADLNGLKAIPGVMAVVKTGGQVQVVVGQHVDNVYDAICEVAGFEKSGRIDENCDTVRAPLTARSIGGNILDGLAGCLTPLIPMMMCSAMFKMLAAVLGPSMLGVLADGSDLLTLFTFVGDAGFYFLPIIVGFTAARKFGATPVLGMMMGAIFVHPTFMGLASAQGASLTVYGIPVYLQNYASSILPAILSVWVMSYIERWFRRLLPATLRTVFAPFFTFLVMLPVALCALGPAGAIVGSFICNGLLSFSNYGGFLRVLAIALIAALWEYLVMAGMHSIMISTLILVFSTNGSEFIVGPAAAIASISVGGMCLGALLRFKDKEERALAGGFLLASLIGGVTEPALYGLGIKYRRPFIGMMIGGFLGGLYCGTVGAGTYALIPVASLLAMLNFAGGPQTDLINGVIACIIAFIGAAAATYLIGIRKREHEPV